jgi:carotenoid cleavage dioxygenase
MTAHPKVDPKSGELLFYSYAGGASRELVFYCADRDGKIIDERKVPTPFSSAMNHDFVITENYVIFSAFPLTFSEERMAKGQFPIAWEPKLGTRFGVMPRRRHSNEIIWFQTDACFAFHFMNAFEGQGTIAVDGMEVHSIPDDAKPFQGEKDEYPTRLTRWNLDLQTQSVTKEVLDTTPRGEMPRMDERFCGQSYQHGYFVAAMDESKPSNWWNAIVHFHHSSKTRRTYLVPDGDIVNEAIFIPKSDGKEGEGYLISLVYRGQQNRTDLLILDSMKIDSGPIAIVELPHRVPFGFHGCWKPGH